MTGGNGSRVTAQDTMPFAAWTAATFLGWCLAGKLKWGQPGCISDPDQLPGDHEA